LKVYFNRLVLIWDIPISLLESFVNSTYLDIFVALHALREYFNLKEDGNNGKNMKFVACVLSVIESTYIHVCY
jgi:hypothetical protein